MNTSPTDQEKPGLSGPRTQLSWDRTALSAAGLGALSLKLGLQHEVVVEVVAGAIALLLAAVLAVGVRRARLSADERSDRASSGRSLRLACVLTTGVGVLLTISVLQLGLRG